MLYIVFLHNLLMLAKAMVCVYVCILFYCLMNCFVVVFAVINAAEIHIIFNKIKVFCNLDYRL